MPGYFPLILTNLELQTRKCHSNRHSRWESIVPPLKSTLDIAREGAYCFIVGRIKTINDTARASHMVERAKLKPQKRFPSCMNISHEQGLSDLIVLVSVFRYRDSAAMPSRWCGRSYPYVVSWGNRIVLQVVLNSIFIARALPGAEEKAPRPLPTCLATYRVCTQPC